MSIKLVKEETILNGFLKVVKAEVEHTLPDGRVVTYNRSKVEREDAVGVVIENVDKGTLVFVRQHRYPVGSKIDPMILEIVAGRVEEGQSTVTTAIRETEEEIGYLPDEKDVTLLTSYFTSPGYSSERITLYHAKISDSQKVSAGGGLLTENEFIIIEEYTYDEVTQMLSEGVFQDGKTQMALFMFFAAKTFI